MVALASQNAGGRVGFLNPTIYGQGRSHAGTFDDVLPVHTGDANVRVDNANGVNPIDGLLYSIRTFNNDTSLHVTKRPPRHERVRLELVACRYVLRMAEAPVRGLE